ncbi:MAG: 5'/3'-nucleotidase SurE [Candidatus Omnitrophota bacterium]
MRVLLTNDDGIYADGLDALYQRFRKKFKVTVCAPESERSAIGHAITLNRPLRVKQVKKNAEFFGYAVDGTPADCVKIAVRALLKEKPQLIISGINHGPNLGSDIMYSGTVSAATEGTILKIPSIAVSLATYDKHDFKTAADIAYNIALKIKKNNLPEGILLNVNVPPIPTSRVRGYLITEQGRSFYKESFVKRSDPRGMTYYWLTGKAKWLKKPQGSDIRAIEDNYVSVTPLQFDLTAYNYLNVIKKLNLNSL